MTVSVTAGVERGVWAEVGDSPGVSVDAGASGVDVTICKVGVWTGDGGALGVSTGSAVTVRLGLHWMVRVATHSSPPSAKYFMDCAYLPSDKGGPKPGCLALP